MVHLNICIYTDKSFLELTLECARFEVATRFYHSQIIQNQLMQP